MKKQSSCCICGETQGKLINIPLVHNMDKQPIFCVKCLGVITWLATEAAEGGEIGISLKELISIGRETPTKVMRSAFLVPTTSEPGAPLTLRFYTDGMPD